MAVSTQSLVTTLKDDYCQDFSRTKILAYLDRAQRGLFNQDAAQMVWLNSSDDEFPLPILQTTEGTLSYEISAANLVDSDGDAVTLTIGGYTVVPRKLRPATGVFIQSAGVSNYSKSFSGERFDWAGVNSLWAKKLNKLRFYSVPGIPYARTDIRGCTFQFAEDPGTTTDMYYVEFYVAPVSLTSESIPLSLEGDEWEEALIDGVVGYVEDVQNGRSERLQRFMSYWRPRFRNAMNAGMSQRKPMQMPIRECG